VIQRLFFLIVVATVALVFAAATVAALLWGKRRVVWQVHRSEREAWKERITAWRILRMRS